MAFQVACENPGCDRTLEVAPGTDEIPAGWWQLERHAPDGGQETVYAACSLACVREIAELFDGDDRQPQEG